MIENKFISFEGKDGCGKDTQLDKLVSYIKEDNNGMFGNKYSNIWVTREPTLFTEPGREISKAIREREVSASEASELFVKDRIEHSKLITKFLETSHVLCSRYDLSTLSYQMTQGEKFDDLYEMHNYGEGSLIPDLTLVFDVETEEAFRRMGLRDSVEEIFEKRDFQAKVGENIIYCVDELRKRDGRRIEIIDANQSIEEVTLEMLAAIKKNF